MNSLIIDQKALEMARRQFCLDIGLPWEVYENQKEKKNIICKARYRENSLLVDSEGARNYEGRDDFFHAMICLGQLFLVVDEQIYDWAVKEFAAYPAEWFCEFENLRKIDEKLKRYGHRIRDTHVYMLPEAAQKSGEAGAVNAGTAAGFAPGAGAVNTGAAGSVGAGGFVENVRREVPEGPVLYWYDQQEILRFAGNNRFSSAICFSQTQPDMLAVAALRARDGAGQKETVENAAFVTDAVSAEAHEKPFDQARMAGMAGVSADGACLWQIGINVVPEETGRGLGARLVREMKDRVLAEGRTPFYGTSESHTISQNVGLKAGFVPAWTEVYVGQM